MFPRRTSSPGLQLLGRGMGLHQPLRGLQAVHHADPFEAMLVRVGQIVVGSVGARKLSIAGTLSNLACRQQTGLGWDLVGRTIYVPEERSLQVIRDRVLFLVKRDLKDFRIWIVGPRRAASEDYDLAEFAAEGHLCCIVQVQLAEHEHGMLLERVEYLVGRR